VSSVNLELPGRCITSVERELDLPAATAKSRVAPYYRWKAVLDRTLAALMLIPGLPLLGVLVVLVRGTSRGPAIFKQPRMGKDGRVFTMYKLRSMRQDAERGTGPVWSGAGDPRVTRLGRWLRKLHLDELPQILNVLKGEMSLIGPRPERPEFVSVLADQIPGYRDRLAVLPGVTGLAQINLPPDQTLDDVRRKLVLDREYIEHAGLWLDLRMLACTLLRMLGTPGLVATRITRLERKVDLPPHDDIVALGGDGAEASPAALAGLFRNASATHGNGHSNGNGNGNGTGHGNGHGNGNGHANGNGNGHHRNGHAKPLGPDYPQRTFPK
jgi:lipopolysaccharide/colanic/teichoic acid biosynthesis glycosyltransferase